MARPRHPKKDLEEVLQLVEAHGWSVEKRSKYFMAKCGCEAKHLKTIHLTPSDPNYGRNLLAWFRRQACWTEA